MIVPLFVDGRVYVFPLVPEKVIPLTVLELNAYGTAAKRTRGVISPSLLKLIPKYQVSLLKSTDPGREVVSPNNVWNTPFAIVIDFVSVQVALPAIDTL